MEEGKEKDGSTQGAGASRQEAREARAYYLRYARDARSMAQWDRAVGVWNPDVPLRTSPGYYRAADARKQARAYRLEIQTGKAHCYCHLKPSGACPMKPDAVPYWKRGSK